MEGAHLLKIKMIKNILLVDLKQPKAPEAIGFNEFIEPIGLCYIASFIHTPNEI